MIIKAPWTEQQTDALNAWQTTHFAGLCFADQYSGSDIHEFTCGNNSKHPPLYATQSGWICLACSYEQDWAHDFMMEERTNAKP